MVGIVNDLNLQGREENLRKNIAGIVTLRQPRTKRFLQTLGSERSISSCDSPAQELYGLGIESQISYKMKNTTKLTTVM